MASAAETKNVKVDVSEASAGRPAVYTLKFELGDNPAMMQAKMLLSQIGLSLAITDEWALFSTNPVALKKELQKLGKPRDVSADVKKYFAEIPANATAFSYHDWKPTVRTLWDLAAGSAALIGGASEDLPVNLQDIPTRPIDHQASHAEPRLHGRHQGWRLLKSVGSFGLRDLGFDRARNRRFRRRATMDVGAGPDAERRR